MKDKQPAKTAAERKRAQRQRMRERGRPDTSTFDAALREHVLGLYQAGELSSRRSSSVWAATGAASERWWRDAVCGRSNGIVSAIKASKSWRHLEHGAERFTVHPARTVHFVARAPAAARTKD
jgi:hypothetical protein